MNTALKFAGRDVVEIVRHELQAERYHLVEGIPQHMLEVDAIQDIAGDMYLRMNAHIYGKWEPDEVHEYPSDWWQAFKARWFPKWALKRWPALTTTVTAKRGVIYPEFANCGRGVSADRLVVVERRGR